MLWCSVSRRSRVAHHTFTLTGWGWAAICLTNLQISLKGILTRANYIRTHVELGRTIINGNNNYNSRQTARKRERGTNPERCVYSVAAQSNGSPFSHEENVSEVSALLWLRARAPFPVFLRATPSRMRLCGRVIFYWEIQREKHPHSALFRKSEVFATFLPKF